MSSLASSYVLRGAPIPAPRLPRLPHLRVVGPTERRGGSGTSAPGRSVLRVAVLPRPAPLSTPLRLTRRGRGVVGLALAAGVAVPALAGHLTTSAGTPVPAVSAGSVAAAGTGAGPWSAGSVEAERVAAGTSAPPTGWAAVTVAPGDSLWAIAGRAATGDDRRDVVGRIVARNGLVGTEIAAGDALLVPAT